MSEPWICTFPVSAEVWDDAAITTDELFDIARREVPPGYFVVSERSHYVPARIDEYGPQPERYVIVVRALPVDAQTPGPIPRGDQAGGASAPGEGARS